MKQLLIVIAGIILSVMIHQFFSDNFEFQGFALKKRVHY